jgi:hypothetical protein
VNLGLPPLRGVVLDIPAGPGRARGLLVVVLVALLAAVAVAMAVPAACGVLVAAAADACLAGFC